MATKLRARLSPVGYAVVALAAIGACLFLLSAKTTPGESTPVGIALIFALVGVVFAFISFLRFTTYVVLDANELRVVSALASRRATYQKSDITKVYWEQLRAGNFGASFASWCVSLDILDVGHVRLSGLVSATAATSRNRAEALGSWANLPAYQFKSSGD